MNCPSCQLAFTKQRKPLVFGCGHTFCSDCISPYQQSICLNCTKNSKPVINYAIFEHLAKKNTSNIDKYIKICLFGNMDVGKSSLLKRLIDDQFQFKMNPTIGIDFKFIDKEIGNKNYRFQIWDSAGQQRYRAVSSNHLKGADIVLLVYDLSMDANQNGLGYWFKQILNFSEQSNVIIIGNKTDLIKDNKAINCMSVQQKFLIDNKNWTHLKVSCLSRQNIDDLWSVVINKSKIVKGVSSQQRMKSVFLNKNPSRLSYKQPQQKSSCC